MSFIQNRSRTSVRALDETTGPSRSREYKDQLSRDFQASLDFRLLQQSPGAKQTSRRKAATSVFGPISDIGLAKI